MAQQSEPASHFVVRAADRLAAAVLTLVQSGVVDSQLEATDRLLDYATERFGYDDPIHDLEQHLKSRPPPQHQ